jgi:hypothetical protein
MLGNAQTPDTCPCTGSPHDVITSQIGAMYLTRVMDTYPRQPMTSLTPFTQVKYHVFTEAPTTNYLKKALTD